MSAAVSRSRSESRRSQDTGEKPVSGNSRWRNGAKWKGQMAVWFTGGTEMERSADGLSRMSQAREPGAATRERFSLVKGKSVLVSRRGIQIALAR